MIREYINTKGNKIALTRARELAQPIYHWFLQNGKLLDLGCGVGHLGYEVATKTNNQLTSLDISTYPFTHQNIKVELYDGKIIPYPDKFFTCSMIAYTLHHTKDPINILSELKRVTSKTLVVCEDLMNYSWEVPIEVIKDLISNYFFTNITLQYKTILQWEEIFSSLNLEIVEKKQFRSGKFKQYKHVSWKLICS